MPVSITEMRVHKYIPERLFGFAIDTRGRQVFFHLGSFVPGSNSGEKPLCEECPRLGCTWAQTPAPPIVGERVDVHVDFLSGEDNKAPRAERVIRLDPPRNLYGVVDLFDHLRGFGFVKLSNGESFHLHKSETLDGKVPIVGQTVSFYAGVRQGKPRACHVKVCPS